MTWMRRSMLLWLVVAALVVLGGTGWWLFAAPRSTPTVATFVGRGVCAECHPRQAETWRGSDHDLAMQPADRRTVLADFGGPAPVKGAAATFLWRDDKPFVRTEGPTGRIDDFEIAEINSC